jgi:hypothetical protein
MQCSDALAFEAAAALEAYEERLLALRGVGTHLRNVAEVQRELGRVCNCCLRLPQLAGASVDLLLAHHKLLADLARAGKGPSDAIGGAGLEEVQRCVFEGGKNFLYICCHVVSGYGVPLRLAVKEKQDRAALRGFIQLVERRGAYEAIGDLDRFELRLRDDARTAPGDPSLTCHTRRSTAACTSKHAAL